MFSDFPWKKIKKIINIFNASNLTYKALSAYKKRVEHLKKCNLIYILILSSKSKCFTTQKIPHAQMHGHTHACMHICNTQTHTQTHTHQHTHTHIYTPAHTHTSHTNTPTQTNTHPPHTHPSPTPAQTQTPHFQGIVL